MTYPQAIVLAAALIAGAIAMTDKPAESAFGGGEYQLVPSPKVGVYRLNTGTGEVSFCRRIECKVIPWVTQ